MEITCRGLKLRQMKYSKLVPKLEQLEMVDFLYLSLNSVGEFIFVSHLFQLALTFCSVQDLRVGNTLGFYLVLIMLDDLFYLWLHLAMHKRRAYPYIHKHHHRQVQPFRGYYDANNTNPLEAIANYLSTAAAFGVTVMVMGVPHLLGVVSYLMVLSICNIMNHHAYDIGLYVPFEFRPYDHQVHHRFPTKNYARMTMIWDKLWGSYSAGPPRTD
jgi:sterol desaturase/sphingolipid hydroxylase (fatty acid hydroxylase superfamily)